MAFRPAIAALPFLAAVPLAAGQNSASIDFSGTSISSANPNPPDLVRSSPATISSAEGYLFSFNPTVRGTGIFGLILIPNATPLGDVLNGFFPGGQRTLHGATRNPGGAVPAQLDREILAGTFSGLNISLTFDQRVLADRHVRAGVLNIQKPSGFGLSIISGGGEYQTFTPPPATRSEWHFTGDLSSVRQSGLAPASGPGKLRYLDDPAFGPILGGPGEETVYPNPPTPQDITRPQSAFGTASSFGLPGLGGGGSDDTVYRTSAPRNNADPSNAAKRRGIGLALFPNTRDYWPDDRLGAWTFVWDLLIPASSWNAGEIVASLIEDNYNNDSSADMFIRNVGGQARVGYSRTDPNTDPAAAAIQPGVWFRLALVSDGYRTNQGRLFVNGQFIGTTGGDWVYASTKSSAPTYGDVSSTNPLGTAVAPADWAAWGQFPSPWVRSPADNTSPMASTICLFSDLQGRGQSLFIANLAFTDEALTDGQVAALGGPSGRGIFYLEPVPPPPCPPDFNGDGFLDFFDADAFVACFEGIECPPGKDADFNGDGFVDFFDADAFVEAFEAGC